MRIFISIFLLIAGLAITACSRGGAAPTPTESDPDAVKTAAAETAMALLDERNNQPTSTSTPVPPTSTPTLSRSETPVPSPTKEGTPVPTGGVDGVEFVADVTIPDGEQFSPGEEFVKTWRLRNSGTSIWSPDYNLIYVSGSQMSGPDTLALSEVVPPGETADIS
ncbi:MAG: NBR1-Ig-like domain-containing protein, partial [Anaerolineales bacterium]|nr:NBR1-Ig-like domain-containing protein [Anaerolineales bacterium]